MSSRKYITVNDQRVYDWSDPETEYTCDGCSRVLRPDQPQIHLSISGFKQTDGSGFKHFKSDYIHFCYPGCLSQGGGIIASRSVTDA